MDETCWPGGVPAMMPADDRAEIEELFARYAWGIDLADEELAIGTFARDAEFDHLWQGKVHGHEAIRENLRKLWYDRQHWWYGRQHLMNHFMMEPRPEGARVRCFFQIIQLSVDYGTSFIFGIGTRDDRLVREGGRWKFRRLYVNAWTQADQVPGRASGPFPSARATRRRRPTRARSTSRGMIHFDGAWGARPTGARDPLPARPGRKPGHSSRPKGPGSPSYR